MPPRWRDLGLELDEVSPIGDTPAEHGAGFGYLRAMIEQHRPAWQRDALCREYPDLPWFPERGDPVGDCKAVCGRCVVAEECRRYAAEQEITDGCWGGLVGRKALGALVA